VFKTDAAEEISWLSISIAFLSIDGIMCDIPMCRGKNDLSHKVVF
jgi:hypothetical protein